MRYSYEIEGTGANGQTWATTGEVESARSFFIIPTMAMEDSFKKLMVGRAVYGKPGLGCDGPYTIVRMVIERIDESGSKQADDPAHSRHRAQAR
jgi:hypothetical protein